MDSLTFGIGLDVGERVTHLCAIDGAGTVRSECSLPSNANAIEAAIVGLNEWSPGVIAMEAGTGRHLALALRKSGYDVSNGVQKGPLIGVEEGPPFRII